MLKDAFSAVNNVTHEKLCVTHNGADKNRDGEVNYNDETKEYRSKIERFVKQN